MALVTVEVTFIETQGSSGTLVEYKELGGAAWITPSTPANPTLFESYPLQLEEGKTYYIAVSSINTACTRRRRIITYTVPVTSECCPPTYTISPDGTYCYLIDEVAATPPSGGTPDTTTPKVFAQYSHYGTVIYSPGYTVNGVGPNTRTSPSTNTFWWNALTNTTDGPLNRTGLWATNTFSNQTVGFSYCLNLVATKTYYIGCAADNSVNIRLDGIDIINMDEAAVTAALYTQYGIVDVSYNASYTFWHIYPVVITAGPHILELIGVNGSGVGVNPAAFGAEIYDNTPSELEVATDRSDLNVLFSTEDLKTGQEIQIGSDDQGYTCPPDYSLDSCNLPYTCKKLITTATIPC